MSPSESPVARPAGAGRPEDEPDPFPILIAEDDPVSRHLLATMLRRAGYDVEVATDGLDAWGRIQQPDCPRFLILDWMMPGMDGVDVCRHLRSEGAGRYRYVILLTAKGQQEDIVAGLEAGADDYLTKPFHRQELLSRIRAGRRILGLHEALEAKVAELEDALAHVRTLQGLLPICMHCKRIRDDSDTWHRLETYIEEHSGAMFTHSLCQECLEAHYPVKE